MGTSCDGEAVRLTAFTPAQRTSGRQQANNIRHRATSALAPSGHSRCIAEVQLAPDDTAHGHRNVHSLVADGGLVLTDSGFGAAFAMDPTTHALEISNDRLVVHDIQDASAMPVVSIRSTPVHFFPFEQLDMDGLDTNAPEAR